ncbi:MAG TPA: hypothetical protein PL143_02315 [Rhodocyclaceae bacterium]|nr:hypothetical protein [Rhodocyclaceae bacterium]
MAADPATPAPVEIADQPEAAPGQETVATPMQAAPASPKKKGAAKAATTENAKKEKPEMVVRDSFSMPPREHRRLKALREELGKTGRLASKSEVLRAGLALLSQRDTTEIVTLLDALPRVVKGKRSKKQR